MDLGKADKMKMTYEQAVSYLYEIPKFTKKNGLEHTKELLRRLDIREEKFKIIHVAGTNGKGSTIAFLRQLLMAHGKKVGTFTSPHMISIHDRICIGDQPISDEDFTRIGQEVQQMEQTLLQTQDQLSYFEIICLMALLLSLIHI